MLPNGDSCVIFEPSRKELPKKWETINSSRHNKYIEGSNSDFSTRFGFQYARGGSRVVKYCAFQVLYGPWAIYTQFAGKRSAKSEKWPIFLFRLKYSLYISINVRIFVTNKHNFITIEIFRVFSLAIIIDPSFNINADFMICGLCVQQ